MDKSYKVLWGVFAKDFEDLNEAMEFCARKVILNECSFSEVVTEKYTYDEDSRSSTCERISRFTCHKPVRVVQ